MHFNNEVTKVFKTLTGNGYDCYLVGGAVRDIIMGLSPKDYDFATNALPRQIEEIFSITIPTGIDYGTITVNINDAYFQVTTYRNDIDYDGRRPKAVSFSKNILDDLSRRDFTMNAMAMDMEGNVLDPFNGRCDINDKRIKFVGDPHSRIMEDKLRILRGIRFSATFGMNLPQGLENDYDITTLSVERIREELNKIITGKYFRKAFDNSVSKKYIYEIIPELVPCDGFDQKSPYHYGTILEHTLDTMGFLENSVVLRLAALLHDIGKPSSFSVDDKGIGHFYGHAIKSKDMASHIMHRLKYSKDEIKNVTNIIYHHMIQDTISAKQIKKIMGTGVNLENVFKLMIADRLSGNFKLGIWKVYDLINKYHKILYSKEPFSIKDLAINGHDLMNFGYKGEHIGVELKKLLELVLENPSINEKDYLLELALNDSQSNGKP